MRRHEALVPLSHDHQNALARALRLRKASELDAAGRRTGVLAFLEFVDERVTPHFAEEEAMLARARATTGLESMRDLEEELWRQHEQLVTSFEGLRRAVDAGAELDADQVHATGQALSDHIRYEERELFEQLQRDLPDEVLRAIATSTGGAHG